MKVIPAIDLMEGQVVRLVQGKPQNKTVYSDKPQEIAKRWEKDGADMLHIVDLDATLQRGSNFNLIRRITQHVSIPVQVAGGLRTETLINDALDFADRVVIGTIAFKNEDLAKSLMKKFGSNRIVISVDHNDGIIVINGWQQQTTTKLLDAISKFARKDFTEFLVTNVSRDGTLLGPDTKTLTEACKVGKNVIASGGISGPEDISKVKECNAYGVILGKALYDGKISIQEAKKLA
ncbi:MAG TPA: 1-(5-phosphoribosyl)-5-[(5-phosphoribosylamino)methylideneamino]imidazole-4-carboxamide isomerase [Candidatus Nitrosotenuis sp.]|nr:1-(5-phosphoribosyl)-5-[(5-phosphoribosylamino)methylideneamino]imidazole-4-carboxamide isomerase [Candidatus Nitrosotenuis sp.]